MLTGDSGHTGLRSSGEVILNEKNIVMFLRRLKCFTQVVLIGVNDSKQLRRFNRVGQTKFTLPDKFEMKHTVPLIEF